MDGDRVRAGEWIAPVGGVRAVHVTPLMVEVLPALRSFLVDAARRGRTVTYGEASRAVDGAYPPQGMGRLLDVVAVDCGRRGEPRLDALVVTMSTREVSTGFDGNAARDRAACLPSGSAASARARNDVVGRRGVAG